MERKWFDERDLRDAPIHMLSEEAMAWASGWNAAVRACSEQADAVSKREMGGVRTYEVTYERTVRFTRTYYDYDRTNASAHFYLDIQTQGDHLDSTYAEVEWGPMRDVKVIEKREENR